MASYDLLSLRDLEIGWTLYNSQVVMTGLYKPLLSGKRSSFEIRFVRYVKGKAMCERYVLHMDGKDVTSGQDVERLLLFMLYFYTV